MKNRKTILVLLIAIVIIGVVVYIAADKEVFTKKVDESINDYAMDELLEDSDEQVRIDEYTFQLEKQLYDSKTGMGYLMIAIIKGDEIPEITLNEDNQCAGTGFGDNNRFRFDISVTNDITYEKSNGALYAYVLFTKTSGDELYVRLTDDDTGKSYDFNISEKGNVKSFEGENAEIYVSSLGVSIYSANVIDDISLI